MIVSLCLDFDWPCWWFPGMLALESAACRIGTGRARFGPWQFGVSVLKSHV